VPNRPVGTKFLDDYLNFTFVVKDAVRFNRTLVYRRMMLARFGFSGTTLIGSGLKKGEIWTYSGNRYLSLTI
jgi:hypothetical protein